LFFYYSKTSGRGHKGTYARSGGSINRGFEGGQSMLSQRIPKRGFRTNRFNTYEPLETINLQKIAYFIQKGILNPQEKITIKHLHETGVINKIEYGVKILGRGSSVLQALSHSMNIPIHLEASNATTEAVAAI
jgi:large subunit ribosomal protein L15